MMRVRMRYLVLIAVVTAGCAGAQHECIIGADCPSGVCGDDGVCAAPADAGEPADATPGAGDDAAPAACAPDHDGTITRAEMPLRAGLSASFRIALDAPVSTAGTYLPGGTRAWDLSAALPGDVTREVELLDMSGAWYAESYPGASYAARLSETEELLGVFQLTGDALLLAGVVSPAAGPSRTELVYDPPVTVIRFPVTAGAQWETTTTVSGVAAGVPVYYTEQYEQLVDAVGTLTTPFGEFPVVRTRAELTRTVGVAVTTVRSYSFAAECYGTVATIVSQDYETEQEFTDAAEVRRLAP